MKSTAYIFILIAFLVVCNFIAIYSVIKMKSEKDNSISTLYPYVQKYSFLKSNIESNILFSVSRIKNAQVTAFRNQSSMLSDLFGSETERLFILRISDRYCSSCVDYFVNLFSNEKLHIQLQLFYLTGFQNENRMDNEMNKLGIDVDRAYNIPFLNLPIDNYGLPYLMVLNKNLEIEYCYFPTKGYEATDIENLNMILDCYAKKYETL